MRIKRMKQYTGVILLMVMGLFLLTQGTASARGRMIYIHGSWEGGEVDTSIEPKITRVEKNTTVIWLNESQVCVKISFLEGKTCKEVAVAAPGWSMSGTCYVTNQTVPPGGTISAVFKANGSYNYEVEYIGKNHKENGTLKVGPTGAPL